MGTGGQTPDCDPRLSEYILQLWHNVSVGISLTIERARIYVASAVI